MRAIDLAGPATQQTAPRRKAAESAEDGQAEPTVDVTLVVVTWNSSAHLRELFSSFEAGMESVASWRIVVADNASSDETVALVRQLRPDAIVVAMGRNSGYAAALNAAVRVAGPSRTYFFLNPDVRMEPGCVRVLLNCVAVPEVGIAVPRLTDPAGRLRLSLRREPTVGRALGEALLGGGTAGRHDHLGEVVVDPDTYMRPGRADWATGAAMLLTRECLEQVGEWDESFFLYSEETDFALRARDAGYELRYRPDAVAVHIGGESHVSPSLYALLTLNRLRLFRRRHGPVRSALFRCAVTLNELLRSHSAVHRSALRAVASRRARSQIAGWLQ